ncbi:MAG: hypothetical protein OXL97_03910 [Chloroflexota bacterium]|nr:hypothetical protein [Chloroflexota bacterium]MDE2886349.1 hypothetical protein [Chloroflexota bacterium]
MADASARQHVVDNLIERHAAVFEPVGGSADVDLAVRTGDGQYVEVIIREPVPAKEGRSFLMRRFRPRPHLFIMCVAPGFEAWLLPSTVFERFATGAPGEPEWVLQLDAPSDEPLSDRLSVYRERWALIANYSEYRSTLSDPLALRVRIAML